MANEEEINEEHDQQKRQDCEQKTVKKRALLFLFHFGVADDKCLMILGNRGSKAEGGFLNLPIFADKDQSRRSILICVFRDARFLGFAGNFL